MKSVPFDIIRIPTKHSAMSFNDGRKYTVSPYVSDDLQFLRSIGDETSSICKIINLCLENPIARLMVFLDFDSSFSMPKILKDGAMEADWFMEMYTTERPPDSSLILPLPRYGAKYPDEAAIIENLLSIVTSEMETILQDIRFFFDLMNDTKDSFLVNLVEYAVGEVAKSPAFVRKPRHLSPERIADIAKQVVQDKILPDIERKIKERAASERQAKPVGSVLDKELKHYRILKLWNYYRPKFQSLFSKISKTTGKEFGYDDAFSVLKSFIEAGTITESQIQGCCVSDKTRCRNYIEIYNLDYISTKCKSCENETMTWITFSPVERRVLHSWRMHLLPELVVGAMMSRVDWVDEIYVHENIKRLDSQSDGVKKTPPREADCIIKTKNEKLIIIESSTTKDQENALNNLSGKIKKLHHLEYDGLFYVTPLDIDRYWPNFDQKAVLFGARHLTNLVGYIEDCMKNKFKNPVN